MLLSVIFITESSIDMFSFTLGPIIDRIDIKKALKLVTIIQAMLSIIIIPLFNNQKLHFLGITFLIVVYVLSTIGSTLIYPAEDKILPNIIGQHRIAVVIVITNRPVLMNKVI